jgi:16S rRNA (guanine527-N7)-methyltransferase
VVPAPDDSQDDLGRLAARYGLSASATDALGTLLARLAADQRAPTSISGRADALDQHIADSLVGVGLPAVRGASVAADLGSGAGLPGLVLAAALPGLRVQLVEAQQSKCAYIATLVAAMELGNASVVCRRVESWAEGLAANDLVVARALAAQPVVLEYAAPLLSVGGHLVEWRGARDQDEGARAALAARELGLRAVEVRAVEPFPGARSRHLHVFEKVAATPERFPRRAGVAARRPLGD